MHLDGLRLGTQLLDDDDDDDVVIFVEKSNMMSLGFFWCQKSAF